MQLGEVRVADDSDFEKLKTMCTRHEGWDLKYNKNGLVVWTKANDLSDFKVIKLTIPYKDIKAEVLYDVLHDPHYRKTWDHNMLEGFEICCLNPNNDIGYYAMKTPKPLKNRDFVTQRSWLHSGNDFYIFNHSVNHQKCPIRKDRVRGISYYTGYYIHSLEGKNFNQPGAQLYYVTQSDPKGHLPSWAVNRLTTWLAPKVVNRIAKACKKYEDWKVKNSPHHKPWINPEQMALPRLDPADILSMEEVTNMEAIDETVVNEDEIREEDT